MTISPCYYLLISHVVKAVFIVISVVVHFNLLNNHFCGQSRLQY